MDLSQNWLLPSRGGGKMGAQFWSVLGIMRWMWGQGVGWRVVSDPASNPRPTLSEDKHITFLTSQLQTSGRRLPHLRPPLIPILVYHSLAVWP